MQTQTLVCVSCLHCKALIQSHTTLVINMTSDIIQQITWMSAYSCWAFCSMRELAYLVISPPPDPHRYNSVHSLRWDVPLRWVPSPCVGFRPLPAGPDVLRSAASFSRADGKAVNMSSLTSSQRHGWDSPALCSGCIPLPVHCEERARGTGLSSSSSHYR